MTPRQRAAERELRARARALLDKLDDYQASFAEVRRFLLAEPGVRLLATKTRRRKDIDRRRTERIDLIRYRRPGGPRRPSYLVLRWGAGWDDIARPYTLAEARLWFELWGRLPAWYRAPLLLEESDRE